MPKIKYDMDDSGAEEVVAFGYPFTDGKSTEVKEEDVAKFAGNRFFITASAKAEKEQKPDETGLKAVHSGGGRFVIKDGEKVVKDGLNKADADAFNALSDEDKTAYAAD